MAGAILRFTTDTYGTPTLQHAWRHDGVELADGVVVQGAHMKNLTINPVAVYDSGDYDLTISNPQGSITSDIAHATILPSPFCNDLTANPSGLWINETVHLVGTYSALPFELTNYTADIDIVNADSGGAWLRLPPSASGIGLLLQNTGGSIAWKTYNGGNFSAPINQVNNVYTIGSAWHLRVEASGNNYKAFVNGAATPATQYTSASYPSGRFALRGGSAQTYHLVCVSASGSVAAAPNGDMYTDGLVNGADIQAFTDAVLAGSNDPIDLAHGDFNHNGVMDPGDLAGFLLVLMGP
jgi:hypothetical protein